MLSPAPVDVVAHPLLDVCLLHAVSPAPLGELSSAGLSALLALGAPAPLTSSDEVRKAVRDLLRHDGFKPTGRSKPASEYLIKAADGGTLSPINAAVDACNVVSLHSGLPISVVDLDKVEGPLRIEVAPAGATYVFNASGQVIDLGGLLCLCDSQGQIANAVKDCQRTKTDPGSTRTLSVLWSTRSLPGRSRQAALWYAELLRSLGMAVTL